MKLQKIIYLVFFLILFITFGYIIIGSIALPTDEWGQDRNCYEYDGQWERIMEDGSRVKISSVGRLDAERGEVVTLATYLPETIEEDTYLCFRSGKQDMKFYIDGRFRGEYTTKDTRIYGNVTAAARYFLDIHPEDEGKELVVQLVTDTAYKGITYQVLQGSQMAIWKHIFRQYGLEILIALFLLGVSCITILITLIVHVTRHVTLDLQYLAIALFLAGCWEVANSDLNQLIFRNLSIVNDMAFLMIMLLPIPFMIYVDRIQHSRYHKIYTVLEIICLADYIACTALHNMHIIDYTNTIGFMAIICVTSIFFLVATIIIDIRRHYAKQYRYVAIGMLCVSASAVLQFISYFRTTNIFYGATLALGLVVLFIFAVGQTLDTVGRTYREKQEAIMAGKAKTKFLANVSHEIRTPINTVIGLNTMILRECENPAIRDYAMDIQNASQSLLVLVNDLLDLSKIEFGKMELVEAEYDFGGMIRDVINMLTPKARAKKLAFTLSVDEGIPSVLFGDDIRLRQILVNLLNNAVKYTEKGSVSLIVKGKVIGGDVQLSFHVKDTGIGIQKEDLQKLSEEFIRINDYRVRNVEGTGLGLSITAQLLELMDSKIQVNSVYGKGSDFYFEIKQHIVNSEALGNMEERIRIRTEKEGYQASFVAPTAKILLVDDNSMNRKVFLSLLKQTKVQITEAVGGYDCLEKIKTQKYDLIFLDHMMPDLDGVETLHRFKEMNNHPNIHTPVVALTANVNAKSKEYYQAEGFQAFLPKPINPDNLEKMIVSMLPDEMMEQNLREVIISDDTKELLPAIQGIRWDMALELLQNHNVLVATVVDFTLQGRKDKQRLMDYYDSLFAAEDMDEEETIRLYRVQVHSMKTSAAMIGAIALSELAKYLESAAKDKKIDEIKAITPIFLEKWQDILDATAQFLPAGKEKIPVDYEMVKEYLMLLEGAANACDLDSMEAIADALELYDFPAEQQEAVDKIKDAVFDIDYDACVVGIRALQNAIKQ